mgnify:CR=1
RNHECQPENHRGRHAEGGDHWSWPCWIFRRTGGDTDGEDRYQGDGYQGQPGY